MVEKEKRKNEKQKGKKKKKGIRRNEREIHFDEAWGRLLVPTLHLKLLHVPHLGLIISKTKQDLFCIPLKSPFDFSHMCSLGLLLNSPVCP